MPHDAPANLCPRCLVAGGFGEDDALEENKASSTSEPRTVIRESPPSAPNAPQRFGKPANVILTPEQQPRVLDFGLALVLADDSKLTLTGTPTGSPSYMPPEQAAGKTRGTDARSDVYSLGALLYELLTGRPPFQAASTLETLQLVSPNGEYLAITWGSESRRDRRGELWRAPSFEEIIAAEKAKARK